MTLVRRSLERSFIFLLQCNAQTADGATIMASAAMYRNQSPSPATNEPCERLAHNATRSALPPQDCVSRIILRLASRVGQNFRH
jgi:hypothetical protein